MPGASVNAIPPKIEHALRRASAATGAGFDYLLKTAVRESSLKTQAKAKTSSAAGLFQFIEQTWLSTMKEAGPRHGLGRVADAITRDENGQYKVAGKQKRQAILALRFDPRLSALMAGEFTTQNAAVMKSEIGRTPTQGELYIAHFLGPGQAVKLIEGAYTQPDAPAAGHFAKAAAANRAIFYTRSGKPRSMAQVYQELTRHYGNEIARFASKPEDAPSVAGAQNDPDLRPLTHALFTIWRTPLDDKGSMVEKRPSFQKADTSRAAGVSKVRSGGEEYIPTLPQLLSAFGSDVVVENGVDDNPGAIEASRDDKGRWKGFWNTAQKRGLLHGRRDDGV